MRFSWRSRVLFPLLAAVLVTAGCAGGEEPAPPAAAPAPPATGESAPPPGPEPEFAGEEAEVEDTFREYNAALADQEFETVCELTAPEASEMIIEALAESGAPASTCEEAFAFVLADPEIQDLTRQVADTASIQAIAIDGDDATVNWSSGEQQVTSGLVRTEGEWQVLSPGA